MSTLLNELISINNVGFWFEISNIFSLDDYCLNFIERWFTVVAQKKQLLENSFNQVIKIFASSSLNITSEKELVNAANLWIKHDSKERGKYAIELIKKIRLTLLSVAALKSVLKEENSFSNDAECLEHINSVIVEKTNTANPLSINYHSRYCGQQHFDLLVCGNKSSSIPFYQSNGNGFDEVLKYENDCNVLNKFVVLMNGVIYFLNDQYISSYSIFTNEHSFLKKPPEYSISSAVAFMGKLFVLGIHEKRFVYFKLENKDWYYTNKKSEKTTNSSCTVFEGKIIVSGGFSSHVDRKTVEAYDYFANEWSRMPDMLEARNNHASVSIRNKLYMINGFNKKSCEVYDSFTNQFVRIKKVSHIVYRWGAFRTQCVTMDNKLITFNNNCPLQAAEYNDETNEWTVSNVPVNLPVELCQLFIVKIPKL